MPRLELFEDILYFVNFVNIKSFCHCPYENNKAAHLIAALASSLRCSLIWKDVFPDKLLLILVKESVRE